MHWLVELCAQNAVCQAWDWIGDETYVALEGTLENQLLSHICSKGHSVGRKHASEEKWWKKVGVVGGELGKWSSARSR